MFKVFLAISLLAIIGLLGAILLHISDTDVMLFIECYTRDSMDQLMDDFQSGSTAFLERETEFRRYWFWEEGYQRGCV